MCLSIHLLEFIIKIATCPVCSSFFFFLTVDFKHHMIANFHSKCNFLMKCIVMWYFHLFFELVDGCCEIPVKKKKKQLSHCNISKGLFLQHYATICIDFLHRKTATALSFGRHDISIRNNLCWIKATKSKVKWVCLGLTVLGKTEKYFRTEE